MTVLVPPDPAPVLARTLRAAVLGVAQRGPRRVFPPSILVGDPAGLHASYVDRSRAAPAADGHPGRLDHATRTDVVGALLATVQRTEVAGPQPIAWLARPEGQDRPDCERHWLAAAAAAYAEVGLPLVYVVVTRHGWRDPRSGAERRWRRLRVHR